MPSGQYLEVTMASEPGLAPSPPICWFDGWRGSGTWINVGKTLIARNKVDGVFKMAQEAAKTDDGVRTLQKYFNTSDPYQVCKNLVSMNYSTELYPISGPIVYDGRRSSPTCSTCPRSSRAASASRTSSRSGRTRTCCSSSRAKTCCLRSRARSRC